VFTKAASSFVDFSTRTRRLNNRAQMPLASLSKDCLIYSISWFNLKIWNNSAKTKKKERILLIPTNPKAPMSSVKSSQLNKDLLFLDILIDIVQKLFAMFLCY
jgi:hypothetical protein